MNQTVRANSAAGRFVGAAAPVVSLVLLLGMGRVDTLWVDPHLADAFHARIRKALTEAPRNIWSHARAWDLGGVPQWKGTDEPIPPSAVQLLKPNAMLCRRFERSDGTWATLLLSQCRDAADMLGHYPPICYRGQGYQIVSARREAWKAGGLTITGTEYEMKRQEGSIEQTQFVRDFFVLPDGRIVADMDEVKAASKDYRTLAFGVAQLQLLCDGRSTPEQRDAIFAVLIGENTDLIKALGSARDVGDKL